MNNITFKNAVYINSYVDPRKMPKDDIPEIAFVGRSNVGKSSLLNALVGRKRLALISATPGKTKLINLFLINNSFYFVDLPGYGYSKSSKETRDSWQQMIENYLHQSKNLRLICLLIDIRHKLLNNDKLMITWLKHNHFPFILVLTKADKLSKSDLKRQLDLYSGYFPDHYVLPFSNKSNAFASVLTGKLLDFLK